MQLKINGEIVNFASFWELEQLAKNQSKEVILDAIFADIPAFLKHSPSLGNLINILQIFDQHTDRIITAVCENKDLFLTIFDRYDTFNSMLRMSLYSRYREQLVQALLLHPEYHSPILSDFSDFFQFIEEHLWDIYNKDAQNSSGSLAVQNGKQFFKFEEEKNNSENSEVNISSRLPIIDKDNKKNQAALLIQKVWTGYIVRKKFFTRGSSVGKEIEIYIPFILKRKDKLSFRLKKKYKNDERFFYYRTIILESRLFTLHADHMKFTLAHDNKHQKDITSLPILEIVTVPFQKDGREKTWGLPTEEEVDKAVYGFISLLEEFTEKSAQIKPSPFLTYTRFEDFIKIYNNKYPYNQISINHKLVAFFNEHDEEMCFCYSPMLTPYFSPEIEKTESAKAWKPDSGELIMHPQITFSFSLEQYRAANIPSQLNNTPQQLQFLKEAEKLAESVVQTFPLSKNARKETIIGLLIICIERIWMVTKASEYKGLHEIADRPVLYVRAILQYMKKAICNNDELNWFKTIFKTHYDKLIEILQADSYTGDYPNRESRLTHSSSSSYTSNNQNSDYTYHAIIDLFSDFSHPLNIDPNSVKLYKTIKSEYSFFNFKELHNKNLFSLQRSHNSHGKEIQCLGEARRLKPGTLEDIKENFTSKMKLGGHY